MLTFMALITSHFPVPRVKDEMNSHSHPATMMDSVSNATTRSATEKVSFKYFLTKPLIFRSRRKCPPKHSPLSEEDPSGDLTKVTLPKERLHLPDDGRGWRSHTCTDRYKYHGIVTSPKSL